MLYIYYIVYYIICVKTYYDKVNCYDIVDILYYKIYI